MRMAGAPQKWVSHQALTESTSHAACWVVSVRSLTAPMLMLPLHLQDVTFHQCVNLGRFNTEKVVSFVPPDGEFDLMKYRCQEGISLPFRVLPIINEMGRTRMEVGVETCIDWKSAVHHAAGWMLRCTCGRCGAGCRATGCSSASCSSLMRSGCMLAEVDLACLSRMVAVAQLLAGNAVVQQAQRSLAS